MPNIEEHLRRAMAEGKFDNLPGKGQPLHLDEPNPHADPEWELAFRMLKDAGYSLPWIETLREIETELEAARNDLRIAWDHARLDQAQSQSNRDSGANWERSQLLFKDKLAELNKRIRDVNLQVPNPRFQRPILNFEHEIQKITSQN